MSWAVVSRKTWTGVPSLRADPGVNSMLCPLLPMLMAPETSAPFCVMCRAPLIVPAFMGALVNSVITVLVGTTVAPLPGRMVITYGAEFETAAVVVNWLVVSASAFPERSVTRCVAVTVRVAPAGSVPLL